jgi:glutamate-1-semialdehyde 2,1-aminomutase
MSAIRLARGFTGKNKIVKFEGCYHGHSDSLLVKAGSGLVTLGNSSSAGVPEAIGGETIVLPLNNIPALEKAFADYGNDIAAIIIEPIPANNGLLLQEKSYNSLLIFDEVISGFRVGFTGASGYYQIQPDIITYGKIIGGGLPVGAYGASRNIMSHISPEGNVYQAGTLSGNPVAMAAGIAQLSQCLKKDFYVELERKTKNLIDGILNKTSDHKNKFTFHSIGSIFWIAFSPNENVRTADEINADSMKYFRALHALLLENGIYLGPSGYEVGFISSAHSDTDIQKTIEVFSHCLNTVFANEKELIS